MMKATEFAAKCKNVAQNYKTVYMWGCFLQPVTAQLIAQKAKQYPSFYTAAKQAELKKLVGKGYFGTDCSGLLKSVLWNWTGDIHKPYGGAKYASNGVPDTSANLLIGKCSNVSSDFSDIQVGEMLWCMDHCGVYIGEGLAVESTTKWGNRVQITAVGNIGAKPGYNTRMWSKRGKLPYLDYSGSSSLPASKPQTVKAEPAKSYKKAYSRSYAVTATALNMRRGAGITKKSIRVLKKGDKVRSYGYYTKVGLTPWLLVQTEDGLTGFCSSKYLK